MFTTAEVVLKDEHYGAVWMECFLDDVKQRLLDPSCKLGVYVIFRDPHTLILKEALLELKQLRPYEPQIQAFDFDACFVGQLVEYNIIYGQDPRGINQNRQWVLGIVAYIKREESCTLMHILITRCGVLDVRIADSYQQGCGQVRAAHHKHGSVLSQGEIMQHWVDNGGQIQLLQSIIQYAPYAQKQALEIADKSPGPVELCRMKSQSFAYIQPSETL
jgi:hypothetical protein